MRARIRSKAIQGVIAAALACLSYQPDADAFDPDGGDPLVQALVDEAENGDLDVDLNRLSMMRRLSMSTSRALRACVAEAAGTLATLEPTGAQALLRQLAHDPASRVRLAAARGLARFIARAGTRQRATVESGWLHAPDEDERVAFALALGHAAPDFLTDLALHELGRDHRPRVRRAALASVRALLPLQPEPYVRLAVAHLADPDRRTRKLARAALRSAEPRPEIAALRASPAELRESRHRFRRALRGEPRPVSHTPRSLV